MKPTRLFIYLTLIYLSGCCFSNDKHRTFTSKELKLLHYQVNDESIMASDLGDTIKIRIKSKNIYTPENECGGSMCECDQIETCKMNLSVFSNKDTVNSGAINADKENNKLNLNISIVISNEAYQSCSTIQNGKLISGVAFFYQTLNINGFMYNNVYEFTYAPEYAQKLPENKSHIFYNDTYGIIRLAKDSAKTWTLVN